ncbi:alpha/beta fold hydrolase [Pigmentiphaga sp. CHJ604]|uniref:alpha/beta fold hydrolase n=1 Tax=Pigmentiphaga sp. CHJ604 TaxID=3081984 RepID=UPI0030D0A525
MTPAELVLLPGLNNTAAVFDDVKAALPDTLRTHCPDLPALDTVEDLADHVLRDAPPRFWLGGFSFGGYVAMAVLDRAPERIQGIALICSGPAADTPVQAAKRREAIAGARQGSYLETAAASTAPFHPDSLARPDLLARRRAIVQAYGAQRYIAHCLACIARPDRTGLLDGRHPTLLVTTTHDRVVAPENLARLAADVPGSRLEIVADAGHLVPLEQPRALAGVLARWIAHGDAS